jgi:hypothetical protein
VHSVNLAIYLGVAEEFLRVEISSVHYLIIPSMSSFLDILHPQQPTFSSAEMAECIFNYCRAILDPNPWARLVSEGLLKMATDLPATNLVVAFAQACGSDAIASPVHYEQLVQICRSTR